MNTDQNIDPTQSGLPNRPEVTSTDTNRQKELPTDAEPFGPVVFSYSRKQALADGIQVDVSEMATEAGFRFPVFLTRGVFDAYVAVPAGVEGQDEQGRLWDVLRMLFVAVRCSREGERSLNFRLHVRNDNRRPRLVELKAECGARDIDDPSPAITVMLRSED